MLLSFIPVEKSRATTLKIFKRSLQTDFRRFENKKAMCYMCELQFIDRLQKMRDREMALLGRERALSKASNKYIISLNKLEKAIRGRSIPAFVKKRLKNLEVVNGQLHNLKESEKAALEKCKQENLRLKGELQLRQKQALNEEAKCSVYKEKLLILKRLSNFHINTKALPHFVQGMVICERRHARDFIPFKYSTDGIDKREISDRLWSLTQHTDDYNWEWENLICGIQCSSYE